MPLLCLQFNLEHPCSAINLKCGRCAFPSKSICDWRYRASKKKENEMAEMCNVCEDRWECWTE